MSADVADVPMSLHMIELKFVEEPELERRFGLPT
jgi:hypothetical protein